MQKLTHELIKVLSVRMCDIIDNKQNQCITSDH